MCQRAWMWIGCWFCAFASMAQPQVDPGAVVSFADSLLPETLNHFGGPGAVLVIVHAGEVVHLQGYGWADVAAEVPVDPEATVFRVASVTKLFTTLALLQQIAAGKLALDTDLRPHLDTLGLSLRFDAPVTPRHLLTHTTGFDNTDIADATWKVGEVQSPAAFLRARGLYQAYPPGSVYRYANPNMVVAGHLVEVLSQQPLADYYEDYLLHPLGMSSSSLAQPLPAALQRRVAVAYGRSYDLKDPGEALALEPQDYTNVAAADGLATTGADMAQFLKMALSGGGTVLPSSLHGTWQQRQFGYPAQTLGHTLGFVERQIGAQQVLSHEGVRPGFASSVILMPDLELGFFFATNTRSQGFLDQVFAQLVKRLMPRASPVAPSAVGTPVDAAAFAGTYRSVSFPRGTLEKFGGMLGRRYYRTFRAEADGRLRTAEGHRLVPIGEAEFQDPETGLRIAFEERDGQLFAVQWLSAFERVAWYHTRTFHWRLVFGWVGSFVVLGFGVRFLRRRRIGVAIQGQGGRTMWYITLLGLTWLGGMLAFTETADGQLFDHGVPFLLKVLLLLPIVIGGLGAWLGYQAWQGWREQQWPWWEQALACWMIAAVGVFLAWASYWNLIGLPY